MKKYQRKQLLERVDREGATVGATIPDRVEIQGEELDLKAFVFEIKRRDTIPAGERDRVEQAKRNLRRERNDRRELIEEGDIDFEAGERHAEVVVGIDRALNALESLGPTDLQREADAQRAQDKKRWVKFLRKALGHEEDTRGVGTGRGR
ncbi:MAG: DUF5788 family protein [Haloarculaceae archaeon]